MVTFFVPGVPVAKGRPRITKGGFAFTPAKTRNYEAYVKLLASRSMQGKEPVECPVIVDIVATFPIPKSWPKWKKEMACKGFIAHTKTPDEDNIGKAVSDAMNEVVFADDSQVIVKTVRKRFESKSYRVGVRVLVTRAAGHSCQITKKPENINA